MKDEFDDFYKLYKDTINYLISDVPRQFKDDTEDLLIIQLYKVFLFIEKNKALISNISNYVFKSLKYEKFRIIKMNIKQTFVSLNEKIEDDLCGIDLIPSSDISPENKTLLYFLYDKAKDVLTAKEYRILILHYYYGYNSTAIGKYLKCSQQYVSNTISTIEEKLRKAIGK